MTPPAAAPCVGRSTADSSNSAAYPADMTDIATPAETTATAGVQLRPIVDVAADLGLLPADLELYGNHKAKVRLDAPGNRRGRLILVSAIGPTKAGEGKTTVSVGLADGLRRLGSRVALGLREPSLGPVFGIKGGGTGGGAVQVEPAADINLHFTGDLHAVAAAHNLLAAMVDNDLHFGGASGLTPETTTWARVIDVNDRALRSLTISRGSPAERDSRVDITAASEIMAILALASSYSDLRGRLARIVVGSTRDGVAVTAEDLGATDALLALLKDALKPNLVQTREGTPAFVHCGPFGNIAHGCSSVVSTDMALRLADLVVSEAGFGFDLGGEKFLNIKMRQSGHWPHLVVLVATIRALRSHGAGSLMDGLGHLRRQLANVDSFGLDTVVAINVFPDDTEQELQLLQHWLSEQEIRSARFTGFSDGGAGGEELALAVLQLLASQDAAPQPRFSYEADDPIAAKILRIARNLYGAAAVSLSSEAWSQLEAIIQAGYGHLPVCIAKTHLSFSADPRAGGLASNFELRIQEIRLSAGAGFVVALAGNIVTMPALPRRPAALSVRVSSDGVISGLMQGE